MTPELWLALAVILLMVALSERRHAVRVARWERDGYKRRLAIEEARAGEATAGQRLLAEEVTVERARLATAMAALREIGEHFTTALREERARGLTREEWTVLSDGVETLAGETRALVTQIARARTGQPA